MDKKYIVQAAGKSGSVVISFSLYKVKNGNTWFNQIYIFAKSLNIPNLLKTHLEHTRTAGSFPSPKQD